MTSPTGIDILCDAAAHSTDVLTSLFAVHDEPDAAPAATPQTVSVKRVRLSSDISSPNGTSPAASSHVCHICRRVYERADHLTRHMRSHENARQYQCSRCPKRFNRADLLTRHEATHDRDGDGKGRTMIRRSDRAAEACLNCSSSKSKCDDQKPCSRCKAKNLVCRAPTKKVAQYRTADDGEVPEVSASEASTLTSHAGATSANIMPMDGSMYGLTNQHDEVSNTRPSLGMGAHVVPNFAEPSYMNEVFQPDTMIGAMGEDIAFFNPMNNFFPDLDFSSWNLDFDNFAIPHFDPNWPSPQSTGTNNSKPSSRNVRDPSKAHAAFKRSPWLWEPQLKDYVQRDQEGIQIDEETINNSPAFGRLKPNIRLKITASTRDRLFAIVLLEKKDPLRIMSFPSLELLNYLLQAHFVHDDYQCDSWLHAPSFNPEDTLPELLASLISHGASFFAVPSIWQFGFAMQEIVRQRMQNVFESRNSNTRNLKCLQAFMLELDIGMWSGFKRKTEIAESFLQPLLTMLRRGGVFSAPADSKALVPFASDPTDVLEAKWSKFITRESYKRLAIHLFFHDVQASVALQRNPLLSFTEINFSVPASRDLWKAATAEAWRAIYLSKRQLSDDDPLPRVSELPHRLSDLEEFRGLADLDLCYAAMLHGFWGQITAYREAVRFYVPRDINSPAGSNGAKRKSTHRLWLTSQHQELYRDMAEFATIIQSYQLPSATDFLSSASIADSGNTEHLTIIVELFQMVLHVSLEDLQNFAGKSGEEEARRTSAYLEESWVTSSEARHAVWHAGQVIGHARRMQPTSLRDFNAMAVYFASLTLWVYGLLSSNGAYDAAPEAGRKVGGSGSVVLLDSFETRETKAFLQLDRGNPGLTVMGDPQGGVEPLANSGLILTIARNLFRDNFPVRSEPLPPLVESISKLLRDLGSGQTNSGPSRASRAVSEICE